MPHRRATPTTVPLLMAPRVAAPTASSATRSCKRRRRAVLRLIKTVLHYMYCQTRTRSAEPVTVGQVFALFEPDAKDRVPSGKLVISICKVPPPGAAPDAIVSAEESQQRNARCLTAVKVISLTTTPPRQASHRVRGFVWLHRLRGILRLYE